MKSLFWNSFKPNKIHLLLLGLIVTVIALHHRRPDALINPQFWMEDGEIFFLESYKYGFLSFFLPYAEYVHVFPRTISIIGHYIIPFSAIPLFYNIMSLIAFLLTVIYVWFRGPENKVTTLLMILSLTWLPFHNEVFMNITNQQWSLAFILLLPLCYPRESKFWSIFDAIIILIVGLTGPFSTIFYPIVLVKWYLERERLKANKILKLPYYTFTFTALLQLALILILPLERSVGKPGIYGLLSSTFQIYYQQFAMLTSFDSLVNTKNNLTIFLGIIFLCCMLFVLWKSFRKVIEIKNYPPFVFLSASLLMFIATMYGFRNNPDMIDPISTDRYFYIPSVVIFWTLFYFIESKKYLQYVGLFCFAIILVMKNSIIPVKIFREMHWEKYVDKFEGKEPFEIPINPPDKGWIIKVVPKK